MHCIINLTQLATDDPFTFLPQNILHSNVPKQDWKNVLCNAESQTGPEDNVLHKRCNSDIAN
jgi:hypothetical protein